MLSETLFGIAQRALGYATLGHVPRVHNDALYHRVLEQVRADSLEVPPAALAVFCTVFQRNT